MFTMEIHTGNAAFHDLYDDGFALSYELARILRETADKLEDGVTSGATIDINGNRCGKFELENTKKVWETSEETDMSDEERKDEVWKNKMVSAMIQLQQACKENISWNKCRECPFDEHCDAIYYECHEYPNEWDLSEFTEQEGD